MTKRWKIFTGTVVGVAIITIVSVVLYEQDDDMPNSNIFRFGTIRFSSPMLLFEEDSSNLYIFNEGNNLKYRLDFFTEPAIEEFADLEYRNSLGNIYRIKPEYISDKYLVMLSLWKEIEKPNYSDTLQTENFQGQYVETSLVQARFLFRDATRNLKSSLFDDFDRKFNINAFRNWLKPIDYIDSIPSTVSFDVSVPDDLYDFLPERPMFFISLKTGNRDMIVPDEDIHKTLSYYDPEPYPVVIERNGENIQKQMIGKRLGEYEVWKDSSFSLDDYVMVFERYEDTSDYTWHLKHKDL